MEIVFGETEVVLAATVGARRRISSELRGSGNRGVSKQKLWDVDINGVLGEMAFCRAMGIYFDGDSGVPHKVDFVYRGLDIEVRTAWEDSSRLIVRPGDDPSSIYVLVVGYMFTFKIKGWIYGYDAMDDQWKDAPANRRPAFFVPSSELRPIEELKNMEDGKSA